MPVPQVLVAGSGVAALEVVAALRALAGDRVSVELLTDSAELVNRPSSVLLPFGHAVRRLDIARVAADNGARCRPGRLAAVDSAGQEALTEGGERIGYDFL
ncbi:MAG TPA: hypothetical protein VIM22_04780, partial [Solirubrobacteraceae bacterium]